MDIKSLMSKLEHHKQLQKKLKHQHTRALEGIDAQIRELHEKRARLIIRHKEATDALQREIAELARQAKRVHGGQAKPAAGARTPAPAGPSAGAPKPAAQSAKGDSSASSDVGAAVLELLKGRSDMSESLLREKLRARRVNVSELSRHLDKMVAEGVLKRRASNYSLGKKR